MSSDLRQRLERLLLERVAADRFPSPTMMDRVEQSVTHRETAEEYVSTLIDTADACRYPSPTLLDRIQRLVAALDR